MVGVLYTDADRCGPDEIRGKTGWMRLVAYLTKGMGRVAQRNSGSWTSPRCASFLRFVVCLLYPGLASGRTRAAIRPGLTKQHLPFEQD